MDRIMGLFLCVASCGLRQRLTYAKTELLRFLGFDQGASLLKRSGISNKKGHFYDIPQHHRHRRIVGIACPSFAGFGAKRRAADRPAAI
jgi:hypothetical protein